MDIKDKVFLLTKIPYKDTDLVVNLLSSTEGKLSAIIYGGRKIGSPSSFTYHPGDLLELEYRVRENRDFIHILNIQSIAVHDINAFSYHRFLFHSYLLEIISKITQPGNPGAELFNTLLANLQLNWASNEIRNICWIIWQIIKFGGYEIDFQTCSRCNRDIWRLLESGDVVLRKARYQLYKSSGRLVCDQCQPFPNEALIVSTAMIKILWMFENSQDIGIVSEPIPDFYLIRLIKFLNHHLLRSFELTPKSLPLFLSILKEPVST